MKPFKLLQFSLCVSILLLPAWIGSSRLKAADSTPNVNVILWFDTEDYLLPASDDAALKLADFLTHENIRATFKVVGEKARTLERRGRTDVIAALKRHEIGYHSNYHSVQPTPAMYLAPLGWDEGVAEFDRREGPGREDLKRIFGVYPTCYGQPGSSWGPQSYGAMRRWKMPVYLDSGSHVNLEGRPCYYAGILNLYKLDYTLRADLHKSDLTEAENRFLAARTKLLAEGGGIVSIYYHPCEFTHKEFWDGVNFRNGANPPRERWKAPPPQSAEESKQKFDVFERYIRFIKRFPDVRFITASDAKRIYADRTRNRSFSLAELRDIAAGVTDDVTFQRHGDYCLSAAEVFALLNDYVAKTLAGQKVAKIDLPANPFGPCDPVPALGETITSEKSQFERTVQDVANYLTAQGRTPSSIWLGSTAIPPEAYLGTLARVARELIDGRAMPDTLIVKPARLAAAKYVADDNPRLWGWVIFPRGFRAPAMMELAQRQTWTLKPALLHNGSN